MVCQKCGKQLTFWNDSRFVEKIDGVNVTVCENCHNQIHNLFYTKETQKPDNNDTQSLANKITEIKYKVRHEKEARGSAAFALKMVAIVIIFATTISGGVVGYIVDYDNSGFNGGGVWVHPDYAGIAGMSIGAAIGFVTGYLITLLIRYFAELGDNTKKIANATIEQANNMKNNNQTKTQQLIEYKQLLDQGVITQEEFDSKKKQLLGL